ncbi:MAG: hypothetical protein ACI9SC_000084 [Gammaproteobacteria bacterium]|jgi:hypothetical protein
MSFSRRKFSAFSLSFLDIMSCGFGAAVLLFLIIKHNVDTSTPQPVIDTDMTSEVVLLEEEVLEGQKHLVRIRNTISDIDEKLVEAQGLARRIMDEISLTEGLTNELVLDGKDGKLNKIKADIIRLETEKQQLLKELNKTGEDSRKYAGDGNRAYVTGLRMGGKRLLILLDTSGSMLDNTIVNIIRRRNMRDERKRTAPKWKNALDIVDWISAKFPNNSEYQIYTFSTGTEAAISDTKGKWLKVSNKLQLDLAIKNLKEIVPEKGTNLEQAFKAISQLRPLPDNIYLITDGLPTKGSKTTRGATISGKERLNLFTAALKSLPPGVPVNTILSPMEGDPDAANAFWKLSQLTKGSYMSPSEDWP